MEQMYLIEIFIDKVTIFVNDSETSGAKKSLITKVKFGPKVQFIIKEGQLAVNDDGAKDDIIVVDERGQRKWSRTIRVGKSYLFPSYPDTILSILSKFPLEIEVWNDDENEVEIFVGIGTMHWDTQFFHMLKDTANPKTLHQPLSIKQYTPLMAECCCRQVGEIAFILRLSALGESIITEFQQLMNNPDLFVFRTDKAPSMFQCKRIEGDDPNFCMLGSLYETTTLEDPDLEKNAQQKIEVCTELQSCATERGNDPSCKVPSKKSKTYPIEKIRMGDITGPCGNANCPLAHKIKTYIRALNTYKKEAEGKVIMKPANPKIACGSCICRDDREHREECPDHSQLAKVLCEGCGGVAHPGETCEDQRNKMYGTGITPKGSKTKEGNCPKDKDVFRLACVQNFKQAMFGNDFVVENVTTDVGTVDPTDTTLQSGSCTCGLDDHKQFSSTYTYTSNDYISSYTQSTSVFGCNNPMIYNVAPKEKLPICLETDIEDCYCAPPRPPPACKGYDCACIANHSKAETRKAHKPFCPQYKHKHDCPVNRRERERDVEERRRGDDDEDEAEPLPYGLQPVQLGPCPVIGRPCTVPDGYARMYKIGVQAALPPSYGKEGKVCCSKEFERIKKALKEYMKEGDVDDYRCVNTFNVDTEKRCCDKEQTLMSLTGQNCCGTHKLALQEEFKDKK